jgi:hypothetical protein
VNGNYWGFAESELAPRVYGNVTGSHGCVLDLVAQALADDARIDASGWVQQYALSGMRDTVGRFIDARV